MSKKKSQFVASLFYEQYEIEAIERIRKFASLSQKMGFIPVLGFSGAKIHKSAMTYVKEQE